MKIINITVIGSSATVSFDDADALTMPYLIVFDNRLEVGQELNRAQYEHLVGEVEIDSCHKYAVKYLSKYSATTLSLKRKLREKEYSYPCINIVIERLIDMGILDDRRYAERIVQSKMSRLGRRRLREQLYQKGIGREIIDDVLADIPDEELVENGLAVAKKWLRSHDIQDRKDMDKFVRFMQYRGYGFDVIKRAIYEEKECEYEDEGDI